MHHILCGSNEIHCVFRRSRTLVMFRRLRYLQWVNYATEAWQHYAFKQLGIYLFNFVSRSDACVGSFVRYRVVMAIVKAKVQTCKMRNKLPNKIKQSRSIKRTKKSKRHFCYLISRERREKITQKTPEKSLSVTWNDKTWEFDTDALIENNVNCFIPKYEHICTRSHEEGSISLCRRIKNEKEMHFI